MICVRQLDLLKTEELTTRPPLIVSAFWEPFSLGSTWILGGVLDSGKCFGFWDVFLDSGTCFRILGSRLDSGMCFWILGSVFGFWDVFLDSGVGTCST